MEIDRVEPRTIMRIARRTPRPVILTAVNRGGDETSEGFTTADGLKWGETSFAVMIFVRKGADSASYTRL